MTNFRRFLLLSILISNMPIALSAPEVSSSLDSLYLQAEKDFSRNNYQEAAKKINNFLTAATNKTIAAHTMARAYNLRGLIAYQFRNYKDALLDFERAVEIANQNFDRDDFSLHLARYNLANAMYQNAQYEQAAEVLRSISPE